MTEADLRKMVVSQAEYWLGRKEADQSHRVIIDVYNSIDPLPRNYRMKYTDPWCAAFVSAVAQVCNLTSIIFPECGCKQMVDLYKKAGRWIEADDYRPQPGDIILYDWDDTGRGDCTGDPDHVGIVSSVSGNVINVIEGNYSDAVMRTAYKVNARYIRGFGCPDYASFADGEPLPEPEPEPAPEPTPAPPADDGMVTVTLPMLEIGDKGGYVKAAQTLLIANGYDCGNKPLVGTEKADGEFGRATERAVGFFQSKHHLEVDGVIGKETWSNLLCF
jgi:hypothetical protein